MQINKSKAFIFVESPKKIKVFEQALKTFFSEKEYKVLSTNGHVRQAKKQTLNLITDVQIDWIEKPHLKKTIDNLKQLKFDKNCDVYIATDSDREGEAIMWHFKESLEKHFDYDKQMYRVYCRELTSKSIINSFTETVNTSLTMCASLVDAYMARVLIDMFIGFNGSALLWRKLYGCKSLGRVQSVALLKLYEREMLIKQFVKKDLFSIKSSLEGADNLTDSIYYEDRKLKTSESQEEVEKHLENIKKAKFSFHQILKKPSREENIIPLDIGSLSTKANSRYNMSVKDTYSTCQTLYEGIDIDGTHSGLITYMRTDSSYISPEFSELIKEHIDQKYGLDFTKQEFETKRSNNLQKQEAHEAIRITGFDVSYSYILSKLNKREADIYKLIIYHTIAPFMTSPRYEIQEYEFISCCKKYIVNFTKKHLLFSGFNKLGEELGLFKNISNDEVDVSKLTDIKFEMIKSTTKAPDRYSEGSLIDEIKKDGIGRPSTYSYIVEVIKNRDYSYISNGKFGISSKGIILVRFIKMFLKDFINYEYTSKLEQMLDDISTEKCTKKDILNIFLNIFSSTLNNVEIVERIDLLKKIEEEILSEGDRNCTNCEKVLKLRFFGTSPLLVCECTNKVDLVIYGYKDLELAKVVQNNYTNYSKRSNTWKKVYKKNTDGGEKPAVKYKKRVYKKYDKK